MHMFQSLSGCTKQKPSEANLEQLFFFFFEPALWNMEFLGQGSDLSYSYNLCLSCGNAESFNPLCQVVDQTCILILQRHH